MKGLMWSWMLAIAVVLAPQAAGAQCMGGMMGGHDQAAARSHEHGVRADSKAERRTRDALRHALSDERGRTILLDAVTADGDFMRMLIARIAETPEWRALAADRLGTAPLPQKADRPDVGHGADRPTQPVALYTCPMHPEVTSNAPGACPKCGMDLVRRKSS